LLELDYIQINNCKSKKEVKKRKVEVEIENRWDNEDEQRESAFYIDMAYVDLFSR
jgi:hypothetical protein